MKNKVGKYLEARGFGKGRAVSFSKSLYRQAYRSHIVLFNACLFNAKGEEVWWGDVDLTKDWKLFFETSHALTETLILTPEMPYRFIGLKEALKNMKVSEKLSTIPQDDGKHIFGTPDIVLVKNEHSIKKEQYGLWVFSCCDGKDVLKELEGLLENREH